MATNGTIALLWNHDTTPSLAVVVEALPRGLDVMVVT
jgi:hypothetical protein